MASLLHDISVAFGASANLRTLAPRLLAALERHLPVIEVEAIYLDPSGENARIRAFDAGTGRAWEGRRSARFFHQNYVCEWFWATSPALARLAVAPVEAQLDLPVGDRGLLRISFDTDIRRSEIPSIDVEAAISHLAVHSRALGRLSRTAFVARHTQRSNVVPQSAVESVNTEISVTRSDSSNTEIPVVEPLDVAIVRCISSALRTTSGQIYGDDGAARLLGLKPSTLQSKMRKHGIERTSFL